LTDNRFCVIKKKMEKKEVYEHLARIYLDASLKYKKNKRLSWKVGLLTLGLISVILIVFFFKFILFFLPLEHRSSILLNHELIKINFNFDPVKKEIYTIYLNNLSLDGFKTLAFRLKKSQYLDNLHMKVEFVSSFNEVSLVYLKDIPYKWKEFRINLSDFKEIKNWSNMKELRFIIEEWNTAQKEGKLYIDDIRLIK